MAIRKVEDNILEVDTLSDLFEILDKQGVSVRISDDSYLREFDLEEDYEEIDE
jgi:hypothetical protein